MRRFIAMMVTGLVFALTPAAIASAAPIPADGGTSQVATAPVKVATAGPNSGAICTNSGGGYDLKYLPMDRWLGGTTQFHSRATSGFLGLNGMLTTSQRSAQGSMFMIGNFFFSVTGGLTTMASQFCPMKSVGGIVDQAAGTLAQAMLDSAIVTGVVVMALIGLIWSGTRGMRPGWMKDMAVKALVLGIFAIMLTGSAHSTGGGIKGSSADYKPGVGSPGWFATTIDTTVSNLATLPAQAISSSTVSRVTSLSDSDANDPLNCQRYNIALLRLYANNANGTIDAQGNLTGVLDGVAAPPMVISNLWEISGLNSYTVAQFGAQNTDGKMRVICRMLELRANAPITGSIQGEDPRNSDSAQADTSYATQSAAWGMVWGTGRDGAAKLIVAGAPAWHPLDTVQQDKAYFAFALCSPPDDDYSKIGQSSGWNVRREAIGQLIASDDMRKKVSGDKWTNSDFSSACYDFYNKPGETVSDIFDWGDGSEKSNKTTGLAVSAADFIGTLHGTNTSGGSESVISYMLSSISVMAVFGGLSLVVTFAKLMSMFMLFTVFMMMISVLLPNSNPDKLVKYTKEYVSWSLLSAFSLLIMSIIILFTKVIIMAASALTGGPTSTLTMLIAGVAPAAAAYAVHRGFTQIGMPSPMTIKGAGGWGKAIAGGAAAGAAYGGVQTLAGKMQGAASGVGRKLAGGAKNKAMGAVGINPNKGAPGTQKAPVAGQGTGRGAPRTAGERLDAEGKRVENWEAIAADKTVTEKKRREARVELAKEKVAGDAAKWHDRVIAKDGKGAALVHAGKSFKTDPTAALKTVAKVGAIGAVGAAGVALGGVPLAAGVGAAYAAKKITHAASTRKTLTRDENLRAYREKQHDEGVARRKAEQDATREAQAAARRAEAAKAKQSETEALRFANEQEALRDAQDKYGPLPEEDDIPEPEGNQWEDPGFAGREEGADSLPPRIDDPSRAPWEK